MPVMGGIEASKLYKFSTPTEELIPIIILTANATTEARRECEEANVDAYLTKPIQAKKLLSTLDQLYKKNSGTRKSTVDIIEPNTNHQPAQENTNSIDHSVLESLQALSDNNDFVISLVQTFINDTESLLRQMESTIASNSYTSYLEHVHALKGSAGSIGLEELFNHCKNTLHTNPDDIDYISDLKQTHTLFNQAKHELHRHFSFDFEAIGNTL